jgi:hypothetical protein
MLKKNKIGKCLIFIGISGIPDNENPYVEFV